MKRLVLCTAFGCLISVASARDSGNGKEQTRRYGNGTRP